MIQPLCPPRRAWRYSGPGITPLGTTARNFLKPADGRFPAQLIRRAMPCILVIDDEPAVLESLRHVLQSRGCEVLTATGGVRGVKLAREHRPDLILCDLNMAGTDGLLVLNAVRNDPKIDGTPFFVMTGLPDSELERRAIAGGADGLLVKPFSTQELYAIIESRLDRAVPARHG